MTKRLEKHNIVLNQQGKVNNFFQFYFENIYLYRLIIQMLKIKIY